MGYKIKDIVNLNHNTIKKDELANILYLDTANLNQNTINELTEYNFAIDKVPSRARRKVENNDILLSTVRPNQEHYGILDNPPANLIVSTGFAVLSPKKDIVNPNYLYAYLTQRRITDYLQIIAENSTSAYPSIKPSIIANLDIELPSMEKQNFIGGFLKKLESKIKLNSQLIATLEELASTLFKRWFVDFEFPDKNGNPYKSSGGKMVDSELGEIPDEWSVNKLGELISYISKGTTPTKKDLELSRSREQVRYLKVKDIPSTGLIKYNSLDLIPKDVHEKQLKRSMLKKGDVLLSIAGTIGRVNMVTEGIELNANQAVCFIRFKESQHNYFYHLLLKSNYYQESLQKKVVHAVQPNLSLSEIKSLKIFFPPNRLIESFIEIVTVMYNKIRQIDNEKINIMEIRDILIPKLLSGEIKMSQDEDV